MYRALYRKWRPQRFEDVVAQRGIVTALRNQIATGRVGHAYLFTGVRGTGKTTCAKIFAKAVNCLHPHNGDPCGECEICRGIDNGSILDVVEMDAASNNGVDDIRDLRDETAYTPSACQYKVYIIDEVHMLSTAAFNALLKTLEEPPAHVIFILATTEIQKVPATILSRCQRYDFTRIGPEDIAKRVEYIAGQEGLELTGDGAELIARLADGAMRDALSILDTCAGGAARRADAAVRCVAGGRGAVPRKRAASGPAGGHPCYPHAGQRLGAHDPRQRSADRAGIGPVQPVGTGPAAGVCGSCRTGPRSGSPAGGTPSLCDGSGAALCQRTRCADCARSGAGPATDHSDLATGTGSTRGRGADKAGSRAAGKRPGPCGGRPAPAAGRAAGR